MRYDQLIRAGEKYSINREGSTHAMTINKVDFDDEGEYEVRAGDKAVSRAQLIVEGIMGLMTWDR